MEMKYFKVKKKNPTVFTKCYKWKQSRCHKEELNFDTHRWE